MEIYQECPGKQSWQLWCKVMTLWTQTTNLEKSLGKWCKIGEQLGQKWSVYFDYEDYALYVQTPHGYTKYSRDESEGNIFQYPDNTDWSPTSRSIPVKTTT
eukprot:14483265-Ditylum_brightwellii.AAC.1